MNADAKNLHVYNFLYASIWHSYIINFEFNRLNTFINSYFKHANSIVEVASLNLNFNYHQAKYKMYQPIIFE